MGGTGLLATAGSQQACPAESCVRQPFGAFRRSPCVAPPCRKRRGRPARQSRRSRLPISGRRHAFPLRGRSGHRSARGPLQVIEHGFGCFKDYMQALGIRADRPPEIVRCEPLDRLAGQFGHPCQHEIARLVPNRSVEVGLKFSGEHAVSHCVRTEPRGFGELTLGWGGRIRTCECRYQKPVPYHLATPQHGLPLKWALARGGGL